MASGPITSWQIDGETMETVTDFNFGGTKITADGDCSHEIRDIIHIPYNPSISSIKLDRFSSIQSCTVITIVNFRTFSSLLKEIHGL